jgi:hypothetical protein
MMVKNKLDKINKARMKNNLRPLTKECRDRTWALYEVTPSGGVETMYQSGLEQDVDAYISRNVENLKLHTLSPIDFLLARPRR